MHKSITNTGFTLAEVLITLGIIGIIAALTIPGIVQDIQDAQFKTAWKNAYADLSQATKLALIDNSGSLSGLCNNADHNCIRDIYVKYLNYTKFCNAGSSIGNCWHKNLEFKQLNGINMNGWANVAGLTLNNGSLLRIETAYNGALTCSDSTWLNALPKCAGLFIDINGFSGPNTVGKDIFLITIQKDRIRPLGSQGDGKQETCNKNSSGYSCSAEYLYK